MKKESPDWFRRADQLVMNIYKVITYIALICLAAIMIIAFVDVIGEKLAKAGLPVTGVPNYSDWIGYLHVPIVFLSAGYITLERGHTCVDILTSRLHIVVRSITEYFSMIMGILISAFLFYRGAFVLLPDTLSHNLTIGTTSFSAPQWPFTLSYCIGLLLLTLSFLWALLRLVFHYHPPVPMDPSLEPDQKEEVQL